MAITLPHINLRDIKFPEVKVPHIRLPQIKAPEFKVPQVRLPDLSEVRARLETIPVVTDLRKLRIPALTDLDLTDFDIRRLAQTPVAQSVKALAADVKDAALTAVGFGVLTVQKLQVRRREFFDARRS